MENEIIETRIKKHKRAIHLLEVIKQAKSSIIELKQALKGYACRNFVNIKSNTETMIKRYENLIEELTERYNKNYN